MTCCRLVAGLEVNLQQKYVVLDGLVAGVAGVAGFSTSTCKNKKKEQKAPNNFKSAATPATPATALRWTAEIRCRFAKAPATDLQHGGPPCP